MDGGRQGEGRLSDKPSGRLLLGLLCLSAGALVFEINLTRLFAVAQFYHFAFMIVSLAMLGFGASGTYLAVFPPREVRVGPAAFGWLAFGCGVCILGSYLLTNWLPFDSFSITWDRRQWLMLGMHYVALASPFFFSGLATGRLLAGYPRAAGLTYAVNLTGSALGCALALVVPIWLGGEGCVTLSAGLAGVAGLVGLTSWMGEEDKRKRMGGPGYGLAGRASRMGVALGCVVLLVVGGVDAASRLSGQSAFAWLNLQISPYKGLSYALQYPGARLTWQKWNAFSRVDVVRSEGIRSLPGLSYAYMQPLPEQDGVLVDGDDLLPVVHLDSESSFATYMPSAVAYQLRPGGKVLVLRSGGGLEALIAQRNGARWVTAVEVNSLVSQAAAAIEGLPEVEFVVEDSRSYTRRTAERYDVVTLTLNSSYHPVSSGAYSLAEDYSNTLEGYRDALACLKEDGLLVVTRWLQNPPSEELRAFGLAIRALEETGLEPASRLVALRGYNTATILVNRAPFSQADLAHIRQFAEDKKFDLVYAPGLREDEINQHNILPEPVYAQAFGELLKAGDREAFYQAYEYDVRPPTDDQPFFGHYFKWSQVGQVWAEMGKTWQPFGGAGYLVVLGLLGLATLLAAGLVLLPAVVSVIKPVRRLDGDIRGSRLTYLLYFGWIGLAYLLVEIPLIQQYILYLGQPAYAVTVVLFSLLLFSGAGSWMARPDRTGQRLVVLVGLLLVYPSILPYLTQHTLGLTFSWRLVVCVLTVAPIGFLMGMPFPAGIELVGGFVEKRGVVEGEGVDAMVENSQRAALTPWVWGVNGAASVIAAVLAAMLALSLGFSWVLRIGAGCYAAAWLTWRRAYASSASGATESKMSMRRVMPSEIACKTRK